MGNETIIPRIKSVFKFLIVNKEILQLCLQSLLPVIMMFFGVVVLKRWNNMPLKTVIRITVQVSQLTIKTSLIL